MKPRARPFIISLIGRLRLLFKRVVIITLSNTFPTFKHIKHNNNMNLILGAKAIISRPPALIPKEITIKGYNLNLSLKKPPNNPNITPINRVIEDISSDIVLASIKPSLV